MKFAHEFKAALVREGFPAHWVESAVPYSKLKKVIKKVTAELGNLGLDSTTLGQFIANPDQETLSTRRGSGVAFQYNLDGKYPNLSCLKPGSRANILSGDVNEIHPKLTLFVRIENGLAVDATLSSETRTYLEGLVFQQKGLPIKSLDDAEEAHVGGESSKGSKISGQKCASSSSSSLKGGSFIQRVDVPLTFDAEFFELLRGDLTNLDALQAVEKQALGGEISALSKEVTILSKPSKYGKSDLYRWREILYVYLPVHIPAMVVQMAVESLSQPTPQMCQSNE
jgi:E3 ubiquitin-protein ligase BAH